MSILAIVLGYLIGSISTSTLVGKWVARIDIRQHGSGNAGATNTLRVLGWRLGVLVLLVDIFKGILAVLIGWKLGNSHVWVAYASGLAAIAGHNWPVFFGFRGGKGVATTIGVLLLLCPIPTLVAAAAAILLIALTRYVSLGSIAIAILTPVALALMHPGHMVEIVFTSVIGVLVLVRHRVNIQRLLKGKENKMFSKRS